MDELAQAGVIGNGSIFCQFGSCANLTKFARVLNFLLLL